MNSLTTLLLCFGAGDTPAAAPAPAPNPAPLVRPLTSFGAALLDGELYVFGGYRGRPHAYCLEDQSGALLRLSLAGDGPWELLGERPRGLQSVALACDGRALFALGGMEALNARGADMALSSLAAAARYDPQLGVWSSLPDLPSPRSSHAAAFARGKLWVVGGWSLAAGDLESGGDAQHDLLVLDLAAPEAGWTASPAPFARRGLAAAANSRWLAAIGGMDERGRKSRAVDLYEFETATWTRGPDLPEEGFGAAAAALGEEIFASTSSGAVWRLDAGAGAWTRAAELAFPRRFHQLVADGADLVAVGGTLDGQGVVHVERLRPGSATEDERRARVSSPAAARNRQAMWLDGDSLYLFGGNRRLGQHQFAPEDFCAEGWRLDLASLAWTRLADLPEPRQSSPVAELAGGRVWLAGGFGPGAGAAASRADTWTYDAAADAWSPAPPLESPRTQFALLAPAGRTLVLGGLDFDEQRGEDERFRYPLAVLARGGAGELAPAGHDLPRPRRAFGAAVLGHRAYLVGGMAGEFQAVEVCDVFDGETATWSTIPAPRAPRISPQLVALGERLYLAGGSRTGADGELVQDRSIEAFDPRDNRWSVVAEDCGLEPRHLRAFAHRGRLLLVSTHSAPESGALLVWLAPPAGPAR